MSLALLALAAWVAAPGCFSISLESRPPVADDGGTGTDATGSDPDGGGLLAEGGADVLAATEGGLEGGDGAAPDLKFGDGHRGVLTVAAVKRVINVYAAVAAAAKAGATTLTVSSGAGFATGDLLLVVQTAGLSPGPASGSATPLDLTGGPIGRWELARLAGVAGSQLVLAGALANDVAASGVQVVTIPEYTDVNIPTGTSLSAAPWDGHVGGILAFFATGTVTNTGGIDVSALGFRGSVFNRGGTGPCTTLDLAPPAGGQKGEGLVSGSYGDAIGGYGNVANAAGGGNCGQSGGGGGGNGGPGGKGGAVDGSDRGGRGGVSLTFDPRTRLALGGGGGAGQGAAAGGTGGGHGGGVVLVHAGGFTGSGYVRASGEAAAQSSGDSSGDAAAGGGGAGGTIHLRIAGALGCGGVEANGGNGGSSNGVNNITAAPGGGGGGGRVLMQGSSFTCPGGAVAGMAGVGKDGVSHQGAEPSSASDPVHVGTVEVVASGF